MGMENQALLPIQAQSSTLGNSKLCNLLLKTQTTQLFHKFTLMGNMLS